MIQSVLLVSRFVWYPVFFLKEKFSAIWVTYHATAPAKGHTASFLDTPAYTQNWTVHVCMLKDKVKVGAVAVSMGDRRFPFVGNEAARGIDVVNTPALGFGFPEWMVREGFLAVGNVWSRSGINHSPCPVQQTRWGLDVTSRVCT